MKKEPLCPFDAGCSADCTQMSSNRSQGSFYKYSIKNSFQNTFFFKYFPNIFEYFCIYFC